MANDVVTAIGGLPFDFGLHQTQQQQQQTLQQQQQQHVQQQQGFSPYFPIDIAPVEARVGHIQQQLSGPQDQSVDPTSDPASSNSTTGAISPLTTMGSIQGGIRQGRSTFATGSVGQTMQEANGSGAGMAADKSGPRQTGYMAAGNGYLGASYANERSRPVAMMNRRMTSRNEEAGQVELSTPPASGLPYTSHSENGSSHNKYGHRRNQVNDSTNNRDSDSNENNNLEDDTHGDRSGAGKMGNGYRAEFQVPLARSRPHAKSSSRNVYNRNGRNSAGGNIEDGVHSGRERNDEDRGSRSLAQTVSGQKRSRVEQTVERKSPRGNYYDDSVNYESNHDDDNSKEYLLDKVNNLEQRVVQLETFIENLISARGARVTFEGALKLRDLDAVMGSTPLRIQPLNQEPRSNNNNNIAHSDSHDRSLRPQRQSNRNGHIGSSPAIPTPSSNLKTGPVIGASSGARIKRRINISPEDRKQHVNHNDNHNNNNNPQPPRRRYAEKGTTTIGFGSPSGVNGGTRNGRDARSREDLEVFGRIAQEDHLIGDGDGDYDHEDDEGYHDGDAYDEANRSVRYQYENDEEGRMMQDESYISNVNGDYGYDSDGGRGDGDGEYDFSLSRYDHDDANGVTNYNNIIDGEEDGDVNDTFQGGRQNNSYGRAAGLNRPINVMKSPFPIGNSESANRPSYLIPNTIAYPRNKTNNMTSQKNHSQPQSQSANSNARNGQRMSHVERNGTEDEDEENDDDDDDDEIDEDENSAGPSMNKTSNQGSSNNSRGVLRESNVIQANGTVRPINDEIKYQLSRNLKTVYDVWEEYMFGINGGPSVNHLESKYGASWRKTDAERRYFTRRNIYYKAIKKMTAEKNISAEDASRLLEDERLRRGLGLNAFTKVVSTLPFV